MAVRAGTTLKAGRALLVAALLLGLWQGGVALFDPPAFILPGPDRVAAALLAQGPHLAFHASVTLLEMVLALIAGASLGAVTALAMARFAAAERLLLPVVVATQALPVFAIAPLLVIWLGFGLASKVVMATLIVYFPVASAFHDGLSRADPRLVDLARLYRAGPTRTLALIRVPGAMPALGSGLRVAAAVAPIGAVVGEWVGASAGLGFVMLQANARMQTDTVFAALLLLALSAVLLRFAADRLARRLAPWSPEGD